MAVPAVIAALAVTWSLSMALAATLFDFIASMQSFIKRVLGAVLGVW